jgi:hypothetical protein
MNFRTLRAALFGLLAVGSAPALADGPSATQNIKTVFIILMENHNWTGTPTAIKGNASAPYINNTLLPMASHAEQYFNPPSNHPSLPNYLWLEAGTNFGVKADGPPSVYHQSSTQHLVTLLNNAGVTWKGYMENISKSRCATVDEGVLDPSNHPYYAVRHDPFVYFDDVTDNLNPHSAYCMAHIRPFGELGPDLKAGNVAQYIWITPNLCDDMHDTCAGDAIAHGDTWLSKHVPIILHSAAYKTGGALFITWDEATNKTDGPIGMIVLSPFAKGHGYSNSLSYTHGSTLRTMQEIFNVGPFLGDAANQADLSDLFTTFP